MSWTDARELYKSVRAHHSSLSEQIENTDMIVLFADVLHNLNSHRDVYVQRIESFIVDHPQAQYMNLWRQFPLPLMKSVPSLLDRQVFAGIIRCLELLRAPLQTKCSVLRDASHKAGGISICTALFDSSMQQFRQMQNSGTEAVNDELHTLFSCFRFYMRSIVRARRWEAALELVDHSFLQQSESLDLLGTQFSLASYLIKHSILRPDFKNQSVFPDLTAMSRVANDMLKQAFLYPAVYPHAIGPGSEISSELQSGYPWRRTEMLLVLFSFYSNTEIQDFSRAIETLDVLRTSASAVQPSERACANLVSGVLQRMQTETARCAVHERLLADPQKFLSGPHWDYTYLMDSGAGTRSIPSLFNFEEDED
eukprot:ANDGO_00870.mRNA.1 hypothetical protein